MYRIEKRDHRDQANVGCHSCLHIASAYIQCDVDAAHVPDGSETHWWDRCYGIEADEEEFIGSKNSIGSSNGDSDVEEGAGNPTYRIYYNTCKPD